MREPKRIIGQTRYGLRFTLEYDQRCNQMASDYNDWRWWLWVDDEFVGDFESKAAADLALYANSAGIQ